MTGKKEKKPRTPPEQEVEDPPIVEGQVQPIKEALPPPPPAPPPPVRDPRLAVLESYNLEDPQKVEQILADFQKLQMRNQELEQKAKDDVEVSSKSEELRKEAEDMKTIVAHGQSLKELRQMYPGTSLIDLIVISKFFGPDQGSNSEIAQLRRELSETKHAQELANALGPVMQQLAALERKVEATGSRTRPGALGAVEDIKGMVQEYNNLKAALKDIGLVGEGAGGKESLAGAIVDKLGASLMKLASSAGWDASMLGLAPGGAA